MVRKRIWRLAVLRSSMRKKTPAEVESDTTFSSARLFPSRISSATKGGGERWGGLMGSHQGLCGTGLDEVLN